MDKINNKIDFIKSIFFLKLEIENKYDYNKNNKYHKYKLKKEVDSIIEHMTNKNKRKNISTYIEKCKYIKTREN